MKHTPGPWTIEKMLLGDSKDRRSGLVINGPESDPLPLRICDLRCDQQTSLIQLRANAQLIAAAPMLAEALSAALHQLEIAAEKLPQGEHRSKAIESARAALAAAGVLS